MQEYLIGVYKEVRKNPDIVKVRNDKESLEKLLEGEFDTLDYDDYTIIFRRDERGLMPNIYVNQHNKLGVTLKGKVFAVAKDENGNFISLNKGQAKRCIEFFVNERIRYENFDERGRYIPRNKRNNRKKNYDKNRQNTIDISTNNNKNTTTNNSDSYSSNNSNDEILNTILYNTTITLETIKNLFELLCSN